MLTVEQAKKILTDVAASIQLKRDDFLMIEGSINVLYAGAKENEEDNSRAVALDKRNAELQDDLQKMQDSQPPATEKSCLYTLIDDGTLVKCVDPLNPTIDELRQTLVQLWQK